MISKIERSWRHNHRKFSDGSRNNYMQVSAGPEAISTPLYPRLIRRIYGAMNGLGGDAKTEFAIALRKPTWIGGRNVG